MVSNCAGSHGGSAAWPTKRLVRERRREARLVPRRIGVAAGDIIFLIIFLDLPDGHLVEHAAAVRRSIARVARSLPKPTLALAPSEIDDHEDHRVVAGAARRQAGVRRLAYPVWPIGSRLRGATALTMTTQERAAKREAIRCYRTQTGRNMDDPQGFALSRHQVAAFSRPRELFAAGRS